MYEEIWTEPMLRVAEHYRVSSSYMARVCRALNVPTPPAGYWSKKAVGRAPPRPDLPAARLGDEVEWTPGNALPRQVTPPRIVRRPAAAGTEPNPSGSELHPLLAHAKPLLQRAREVEGYLKPSKRLLADILVSKAMIEKAIEAASSLFRLLESRSYRVQFPMSQTRARRIDIEERENAPAHARYPTPWRPDRPTVAYVRTVAIGLTLLEVAEEIEVAYVNGDYVPVTELKSSKKGTRQLARTWTHKQHRPSGRLRVQAYSPYPDTDWTQRWEEQQPGELGKLFPRIVSSLEAAVPTISKLIQEAVQRAEAERQRSEEQHRRWQAEQAAYIVERRRRASMERLSSIFAAWEQRQRVEAFCDAMRQRVRTLSPAEQAALEEKLLKAVRLLCGADPFERFRSWITPDSYGHQLHESDGL